MSAHSLTPEQEAIVAAARDTNDNLMVEARAGAAKTFTLTQIARVLRGSTLAIAFNKKIADEMKTRLPTTCDCRTLNGFGHSVWGKHLGGKLDLFDGKIPKLIKELVEEWQDPEEREFLWDNFGDMISLAEWSKANGHLPDRFVAEQGAKCTPLYNDESFLDSLDEEVYPLCWKVVNLALYQSARMAMTGKIDFADQLLFPTVFRCVFPVYENVLVDEAQDLSELNHRMLTKMVKRRLIAVGDPLQAIYAFRGAHENSMHELRSQFSMTVLKLTTTFRCPEAVCDHVRWRAPDIRSWEGNPNNPGQVLRLPKWEIADIPDGAAILCRNNAPLISLALAILHSGRRPKIWGNDVAAGIVKILGKLGPNNMRTKDALVELDKWFTEQYRKAKSEARRKLAEDKRACLAVFIEDAETLGGAKVLAEKVLNSPGTIDLATGHKSKGAEWKQVFILDQFLIGKEGQEANLRYVMATRAQQTLHYIETADRIG